MADTTCTHQDQIKASAPLSQTCLECQKDGTTPVALRMCLTCGHVGCCDSSPQQHARKHHEATGHPIIESFQSAPAGRTEWRYCYLDQAYL